MKSFEAAGAQVAHILAAGHETLYRKEKEAPPFRVPDKNRTVHGYIYDMESYLRDCVDKYCGLVGVAKDCLRHAHIPFLDESKGPLCWADEEIGEGID